MVFIVSSIVTHGSAKIVGTNTKENKSGGLTEVAQSEICELLRKNRGRKYTVQQLGRIFHTHKYNLSYAVAKLIRFNLVKTSLTKKRLRKRDYRGSYYITHQSVRQIWL